jgi:hypothetical protein
MATLLDLAVRLETRAAALDQIASEKTVAAATAILRDLTAVTPVDVSTAISNWQVRLNAPAASKVTAYYPGAKGSTREPSGTEALDQGIAILKQKRPGDVVHITNVLPYIRRLDEGYSKQAPAGFVERSMMIARPYRVTVRAA